MSDTDERADSKRAADSKRSADPKRPADSKQPAESVKRAGWFSERYLKADPRWLGVFRVVLGVLLCVEVIRRWVYADAFYTNQGLLPNHYSLFAPLGRNVFSIYHAFSTYGEVSVAFALTLVVFACFTLGYRTKLFHVLSAICITSLNSRNLFVENGGTVVVNLLTVWTLLLPLGSRLSIDAVRRSLALRQERSAQELNDRSDSKAVDLPVYRLAIFGLALQWSVIYFFNTVHKHGKGWMDGSAIHWFLYQDRIITGVGVWVREHVPFGVLQGMTYGTLVVEGLLAVLLLIPFGQKWLRRLAFLLAFGLHGSIALFSRLGPFSYVMVIFFILMLGAADWQAVSRHFGRATRRRVVIYDADCGVCLLTCRVLKRLDVFGVLTFQENSDTEALPEGVSPELVAETVVVVRPDGSFATHERAIYEVLKALPFGILLGWWLRVPGLSSLGGVLYRKFAARRLDVSVAVGLGACGVRAPAQVVAPPPPEVPLRRGLDRVLGGVRELFALGLIVLLGSQVLVDNEFSRRLVKLKRPVWVETIVDYPRLYQGWRMFAPEPPYDDGTIVVDARTVDGRKIDPLTGREPDFDPNTKTGWGHGQFWCDYQNKIRFPGHAHNRKHFVEYLQRYHERTGNPNDRLLAFDIWWIEDRSPPPGETESKPLSPKKVSSHGVVRDSLATPWLMAPAR
ncbi:MAG: DUF393 domain-containing protein [Polyangiaceae bacterium]|nr:DUF393 domain-containing protein [Polyangiaceae bacterium]MCW5790950.1 DUF393 domain-containing protein [Polyangiaceae bacterium]